jgi:hypothetical protein
MNWNFIYRLHDFQALKFECFEIFSSMKLFNTLHAVDSFCLGTAAYVVGVDNGDMWDF